MTAVVSGEVVDFGSEELSDLHGVLRDLRTRAPYAEARFHGMPALIMLSDELVTELFKDELTFPAAAMYGITVGPAMGKTIQCMAGQEHRTNRALVSPAFRRALMKTYSAELLEPIAHALVDEFAETGRADLVTDFTQQFPFRITNELLGLPVDDYALFAKWAHDLFFYPSDPDAAIRARESFTDYLRPLVNDKRYNPTDDLLSKLVTTEVDGVWLTDEEIYSFVRLLFPAGVDTTYLSLGNTLWALLTHQDELDRVRDNPDEAKWAVQEGLRWEPGPAIIPRFAPVDVTWHGIDIPAGTWLLLAIAAANRDPDVYTNPDVFDTSRHANAQLSFGTGPHVCLGQALATTQMEIAVRVLLDRLPGLRLADPSSVQIAGRLGTELRGPDHLQVVFDPQ